MIGRALAPATQGGRRSFLHGVASGDPLADRVVLWTRVSGTDRDTSVRWEMARDVAFRQVVRRGQAEARPERDFTVKLDVAGLAPATTYYYRFDAQGERSPMGRTRTLPAAGASHVRVAVMSCAHLALGHFNAYGRVAERADLDAVVFLGDYIYEYDASHYAEGVRLGDLPRPNREIVALEDYRARYAQYREDPDLQDAHRQHPFIAVWDDHEFANNAWRDGAVGHNPELGEGEWAPRRAAAMQAYREWLPVRDEATSALRVYRAFAFGGLADLVMLDTRIIGRDQQAARTDIAALESPVRTMLGTEQEAWLTAQLAASRRAGTPWQLLGQQVMFSPMVPDGRPASNNDAWDGYRRARTRVLDAVAQTGARNTVVLTGDVHSSWAYDVARDPWNAYDPATGRGIEAVEIVGTSVTSSSGYGAPDVAARRLASILQSRPHLKWADVNAKGYVIVDVTRERMQADWYFVPTIERRVSGETFAKGFVSQVDAPRLIEAATPAPAKAGTSEPAH